MIYSPQGKIILSVIVLLLYFGSSNNAEKYHE